MRELNVNLGNGTKTLVALGIFTWAAVKIAAMVKELVGYKRLTTWIDNYTKDIYRKIDEWN